MADCIAIWGRRGAGKSTLAKKLLGGHRRVIVFDPMGEYALRGFRVCGSLEAVLRVLKANWSRGFRIAYVPSGDFPRMLHGLATLIWHAQAPYQTGADRRELLFVVEEMNLGYPATKLRADYSGMTKITLQGRHRGISIIGISQRPAGVSADFRGMVAQTYVLPLSTALDLRAVTDVYGREHDRALRALRPHAWLRFLDGQVIAGKNPHRGAGQARAFTNIS
jgi:DNA helicase HerA-like ATPase